jgi:hypothetical protein
MIEQERVSYIARSLLFGVEGAFVFVDREKELAFF